MNQDWLAQLAPAHAPEAVGWWPPAPGWWMVAGLFVLLIVVLVWRLVDPRRGLRRAALRQLEVIRASDADGPAVARATQNLIRRYAVAVFGRERVARLTGEQWLSFVMGAGGQALAGAPGRSMLAAAFGNRGSDDDREHWFAAAEGFIKRAGKGRSVGSIGWGPREDATGRSVEGFGWSTREDATGRSVGGFGWGPRGDATGRSVWGFARGRRDDDTGATKSPGGDTGSTRAGDKS